MNDRDLSPLRELVRRRSGLQLDTLAATSLVDAVRQRMALTGSEPGSAYFSRVLDDDAEFNELVSLLTINETYFYREPGQLELLTERFLPTLLAGPDERPLRILSAGCSSGEEPYSIAIAIREKFGEQACRRVAISACDIDRHALARARQARYAEYSFRATPRALRERYFRAVPGNAWLLAEPIRRMVDFQAHNLSCGQLPPSMHDLDVVFFRNVSIYFDAASRERILRQFHAAMRDGAYLVLGAAETLANDLGIFRLREDGHGFYFVKEDARATSGAAARPAARTARPPAGVRSPAAREKLPVAHAPAPVAPASPASPAQTQHTLPPSHTQHPSPEAALPSNSPGRPPESALAAVVAERTAAASALVRAGQGEAALEQLAWLRRIAPGHVEVRLLESYALLLARRFAEAVALARGLLDEDRWSADALVLLGLCAKWQGDDATAIEHLRTAAYVRPDCWPVHYYLGGLLHVAQPAKSRRAYRTALLQMNAHADPDGGLRLPLNLPVADLRLLCEQRSARRADV